MSNDQWYSPDENFQLAITRLWDLDLKEYLSRETGFYGNALTNVLFLFLFIFLLLFSSFNSLPYSFEPHQNTL
jgi:hypothetical protein